MKSNKKKSNLRTSEPRKLLKTNSPFAVKEAYNAIRTNLLFTQQGEKCPVFVVTSPTANNGKTINSANMAISFAQMGKRTLVIGQIHKKNYIPPNPLFLNTNPL